MGFEYGKPKSAAKIVTPNGPGLRELVLRTMGTIAGVVGSTLGPGGQPVLIERYEYGLPPIITKDGVTVMRSLGFDDATAHVILEAARDAAVRTAVEAGDGPQPLWSKILTTSGFVEMRDAKIGMEICGTNGTIQKIIGVFPKGKKEIIEVHFEQGQMVECCEDHLWTVTTNYGSTKTITTDVMLESYRTITPDGYTKYRYFVPGSIAEFTTDREALPLDPYTVGVLIGDGSLCDSGSVELSLGDAKKHIIDKLSLPLGLHTRTSYSLEKKYRVKILGSTSEGKSIRDFLDQIGLRNTNSYTKYIPKTYLLGGRASREALLQGLIDTDGHINDRERFEFSTVSEQLAADFKFLCRSLNKSVYSRVHYRTEGDGSYSVRPIFRFHELKGNKYGIKISNVIKTGRFTEMQCIKVSNPDNLYLSDDFIVTHNTTTATVLADSLVRGLHTLCQSNKKVSPQAIVRELNAIYADLIEPSIKSWAMKPDHQMLLDIAQVSANGDAPLAEAVMECFRLVGDNGNVTIIEANGPNKYEVERIEGYPLVTGFEDIGKYHTNFINDPSNQKCLLDKPLYLLYYGRISEIQSLLPILNLVGDGWKNNGLSHNVVIMATGFSDTVLGHLAVNFADAETMNVYPLTLPDSPLQNGKLKILQDMSYITGATVLDPMNAPLEQAHHIDLGPGTERFEATRWRSNVIGRAQGENYEDELLLYVDELEAQKSSSASELDSLDLQERIGKITGGIAKLKVLGSSNGDCKERRDRAEDAVCAVRGALKDGCLWGGGWTLIRLKQLLGPLPLNIRDYGINQLAASIWMTALQTPVTRILTNAGLNPEEASQVITKLENEDGVVYNALSQNFMSTENSGLLDSVPAVRDAIKNALSIAGVLGTLGGCVTFRRDSALELSEAKSAQDFNKYSNYVDEHG